MVAVVGADEAVLKVAAVEAASRAVAGDEVDSRVVVVDAEDSEVAAVQRVKRQRQGSARRTSLLSLPWAHNLRSKNRTTLHLSISYHRHSMISHYRHKRCTYADGDTLNE